MKISHILYWGAIFFGLVALNIYILIQKNELVKLQEKYIVSENLVNNIFDSFQNDLITREINQFINDGEVIKNIPLLLNEKFYNVKDLLNSSYLVVFNLTQVNCNSCSNY